MTSAQVCYAPISLQQTKLLKCLVHVCAGRMVSSNPSALSLKHRNFTISTLIFLQGQIVLLAESSTAAIATIYVTALSLTFPSQASTLP